MKNDKIDKRRASARECPYKGYVKKKIMFFVRGLFEKNYGDLKVLNGYSSCMHLFELRSFLVVVFSSSAGQHFSWLHSFVALDKRSNSPQRKVDNIANIFLKKTKSNENIGRYK